MHTQPGCGAFTMCRLLSRRPPPASRCRWPLVSNLRGHTPRSPPALHASPKVRERVPDGCPRHLRDTTVANAKAPPITPCARLTPRLTVPNLSIHTLAKVGVLSRRRPSLESTKSSHSSMCRVGRHVHSLCACKAGCSSLQPTSYFRADWAICSETTTTRALMALDRGVGSYVAQ